MSQTNTKAAASSAGTSPSLRNQLQNRLPAPVYRLLYAGVMVARKARFGVDLAWNYINDLKRFLNWSHTGRRDRHAAQEEYAILKHYHSIEKGLSLQEPRPGFGESKVQALLGKLNAYEQKPDHNPAVVKAAVGSLLDYHAFNTDRDVSLPWLDSWIARRSAAQLEAAEADGGVEKVLKADILANTADVTEDFFFSRHSIRNFSGDDVPLEAIEQAASIARKTPSVCNRQGPRAHCFMNAMDALQFQSGNAGFGHLASRALVITSDVQAFSSVGERHQPFVDGGLYAMSIVYALHSLGYGSCMLAWDQTLQRNAAARKALNIPDNEVIIMMIAVGTLPDTLMAANAYRRPLSSSLFVHPSK